MKRVNIMTTVNLNHIRNWFSLPFLISDSLLNFQFKLKLSQEKNTGQYLVLCTRVHGLKYPLVCLWSSLIFTHPYFYTSNINMKKRPKLEFLWNIHNALSSWIFNILSPFIGYTGQTIFLTVRKTLLRKKLF